jgi:hypothetical protein
MTGDPPRYKVISHFDGHFLAIFRLFVAQWSGNVLQSCRDFARFAEHLKGTLYDDMSAIICDDGFEVVHIGRELAVLAEFSSAALLESVKS